MFVDLPVQESSVVKPPQVQVCVRSAFKKVCSFSQQAVVIVTPQAASKVEAAPTKLRVELQFDRQKVYADTIDMSALPGETQQDKTNFLRAVYKVACHGLTVTYHGGAGVAEGDNWVKSAKLYQQAMEDREPCLSGWRVGGNNQVKSFVLKHKGMAAVRAAIAFETGTQAREVLGFSPEKSERAVAIFKFR